MLSFGQWELHRLSFVTVFSFAEPENQAIYLYSILTLVLLVRFVIYFCATPFFLVGLAIFYRWVLFDLFFIMAAFYEEFKDYANFYLL